MSTQGELSALRGPSGGHRTPDEDFFIEPYWPTQLLLCAEAFHGPILDPACGSGRIVETCRAANYEAYGSDIVDRCAGRYRVADFFLRPDSAWNIISNPPYGVAAEFARHALTLATRKVALLVQAKFLYSQGRHALFTETPVARIYHLSSRPSMPPGELLLAGKIKAAGGKMDFCWVVWDHAHKGPPTTHWLKRGADTEAEYLEACRAIRQRKGLGG